MWGVAKDVLQGFVEDKLEVVVGKLLQRQWDMLSVPANNKLTHNKTA